MKSLNNEALIQIPWAKNEVVPHSPSCPPIVGSHNCDLLLTAIAKARSSIEDIAAGRISSFVEIAKKEGEVERHIRLLAPLAFVSPQVIPNIVRGSFPQVGVTDLAKTVGWMLPEISDASV